MLGNSNLYATVAVSNLEVAKKFYGETLGLKQLGDNLGGVAYSASSGKLFVYESDTAGSGKATSVSFEVKDVDEAVTALKEKAVKFEQYDIPGATKEGDVLVMGQMRAAWFKDPDGNILGLSNGA